MQVTGRNTSVVFFITLGACLVALAIALNVGWILLNWRQVALLVLGFLFFLAIIAGLILNTTFLVREIRRNEQHDSFINAVTHELKTPIASIRLYLETLKTRDVDEARRREFYDVMLADNEQLLRTVEQVLRAGSVGYRRSKGHRENVDLTRLIAECVETARARYHLNGDAVKFNNASDGNGHSIEVAGDRDELRVVVENLLDNAVKYSGKEVQVQVKLAPATNERVRIDVSDRGIGVPPTELKRIFRRFYRVAGRGQRGTGLGLFIVRSIVKRHGGRVFAESPGEGQGSTFTVELPRPKS